MNSIPESEDYHQPYVVALTGGIASGKTMISDEFAKLGVPVIDADVIAHEIVAHGQPALRQIENEFGPSFIDSGGKLKRSKLRSLIFSDEGARRKLELILHPKIREHAAKRIAKVIAPYCVLVIPLLTEKDGYPNVDRVLVVDVEPETQINRLMARDNCIRSQAEQALASQVSRDRRLKIADDILDNSRSIEQARNEVILLHKKYLQLALQSFAGNQQHQ
ncbi:dephospho-CoA kinase [Pseudomonadota bacterium]